MKIDSDFRVQSHLTDAKLKEYQWDVDILDRMYSKWPLCARNDPNLLSADIGGFDNVTYVDVSECKAASARVGWKRNVLKGAEFNKCRWKPAIIMFILILYSVYFEQKKICPQVMGFFLVRLEMQFKYILIKPTCQELFS